MSKYFLLNDNNFELVYLMCPASLSGMVFGKHWNRFGVQGIQNVTIP